MRLYLTFLILALLLNSCGEKECEAFDKSREIAKWHLFPALNSEYTFSSEDQEVQFIKKRGVVSETETEQCGGLGGCDCVRVFLGEYEKDGQTADCNIAYDQDGDQMYRYPIYYEFNDIHMWFDVASTGELVRVGIDTTSTDSLIKYENFETLTLNGEEYERVLHLTIPMEVQMTDFWVARNIGLVAFQEDSIMYSIK